MILTSIPGHRRLVGHILVAPRAHRPGGWIPTVFLLALGAAACESPEAPASCGSIPQVSIHTGETSVVEACFNDANGDLLSYTATSSSPGVATVGVSGASITVRAVSPGSGWVTITASDPGGLQGQQSFEVVVPNRAPKAVGTIPSTTISVGQSETVDVSSYFEEPDGSALTYGAMSSNGQSALASVAGSTVTVTAVAKGVVTVTVTARDPEGLTATQAFVVTVPNRAPEPVGTIPDIEALEVGGEARVGVAAYFTDPDGDALTYTAMSSRPSRARVSVSGSVLTVRGVAKGTVTVTVAARDPEGLTATQAFVVTVPNRAPEPVGTIPDIEALEVGGEARVGVAAYFTDPDGDALTYTAMSSRPSRARVSVSGSVLTVRGVAKGTVTVTVAARDPEGLTATQAFVVTVPNRAPEPVGTIPDIEALEVGGEARVGVAAYFTDPDGDALAYSASSSRRTAVRVEIRGSTLTLTGVARGRATVTVTAEDPGGLSAEQTFEVTVQVPVTLFEDDFEDEETLDDWDRPDTMEASIEDGLLRLRYPEEDFFSWAFQEYDEITDFTVEVTMEPVPGDGGLTGVVWYTGLDTGIVQYFFLTGELANGQNWIFAERDLADGLNVLGGGTSNDVEFHEFADFTISLSGENVRITVGGEELMDETIQGLLTTSVATGLTGGNLASEYDYVKVSGVFTSPPAEARVRRKIALPKADRIHTRER